MERAEVVSREIRGAFAAHPNWRHSENDLRELRKNVTFASETPMKTLFDFSSPETEPRWVAVNDGVMGGLSAGDGHVADGLLHFSGTLSLENNGGFSSIRTLRWRSDLSDATAMVLRVHGDGRTYQLRLATDARFRGSPVSYGIEFPTQAGEWTEVRLPFARLQPTWRGRLLNGPPLDLSKVEEIGILIGDRRTGDFELQVDWMKLEKRAEGNE